MTAPIIYLNEHPHEGPGAQHVQGNADQVLVEAGRHSKDSQLCHHLGNARLDEGVVHVSGKEGEKKKQTSAP